MVGWIHRERSLLKPKLCSPNYFFFSFYDHSRKQNEPTASKCHKPSIWKDTSFHSTQKMRHPDLQLQQPLWLTAPDRHHAKWQSPACCLKPQHTLRRAETPEEQSKPLWQGSEPLYICRARPSHHRYQLLQSPAHGQHTDSHYVLFLYWATLQRNQSEQSRTSANTRQGDTHSPWPGNIRVTCFSCTISQSKS